jgi:sec-independent protein translocase protein TatA
MFGLGTPELLIVLVLVLIIFGAGKLPQLGGALGRGIKNFKAGAGDDESVLNTVVLDEGPAKKK